MSEDDDAQSSDASDRGDQQGAADDGGTPSAAEKSSSKRGSGDVDKARKGDGKAVSKQAKKKAKADKPGLIARFRLFLRQVIAELRKVIWPTRSELISYTGVVLVFVVIMALILAAYDFAFAKAVFFVFGQ